ncbi:MAG: hypothetical protein LBF94_02900 [Puniceicoccales bacterium]|jgi:ATP-dependent protease HslVU (ClpYQ) peptidase subunit|nr:hypothetical protein [Puniceicoccales bacterium]MDR0595612.1 hypothetical protein [Puniceicoccales bacterium]
MTTTDTSFSMSRLFEVLAKMCSKSQDDLDNAVSSMTKDDKGAVNQEDLFKAQAKLQMWSTNSSVSTSILRGYGDTVRGTAQNIK